MIEPLEPKTPGEIKDYGIDWSVYFADTPEITIVASTWEILSELGSPDLVVEVENVDGFHTLIRLSGGEAGREYLILNHITTSTAEEPEAAIKVRVKTPADVSSL